MTFGFVISMLALVLFVGVVTWPIWWYGVGPLMRARASVDRAILTVGRTERLEQRVQVLTESRAAGSTTPPPSCAASSATCTTARRPAWPPCR